MAAPTDDTSAGALRDVRAQNKEAAGKLVEANETSISDDEVSGKSDA